MAPRRYARRKLTKKTVAKLTALGQRPYSQRKSMMLAKLRRGLPLSGFPQSKVVRLRYVETRSLVQSSATSDTYVFSATSIFDPNVSGTGHYPYGYTQWASIYNHYKVLGSKIKVTATGIPGTQSGNIFAIKLDDDASISTSMNTIMESNDAKYKLMVGQSAPTYLTKTYSMKKVFPDKPDTLKATFGGNPSEQQYYVLAVRSADGVAALGTIVLQVQIDYIVQVSERKDF